MKVKLKRGWSKTYRELTVGNVYRVLGLEAGALRIIGDAGDPALFDAKAFELVDSTRPSSWISGGVDGDAYPPELNEPRCFFEEFHNYNIAVRQRFHRYVHNLCYEDTTGPDPHNNYVRLERREKRPENPTAVHVELDEERWEVRKVETYEDGRVTYAWSKGSTGTTQLGDQPMTLPAKIAADPEFMVSEIDRAEFEAIWDKALDSDDR